MAFPVVFHVGGLNLPAHWLFETLSYFVGFRLYLWLKSRAPDPIGDEGRLSVLIGAILGAGLGSKLLGFLEHPEIWALALKNPVYFFAAKTILGALLGGIIGVEIAKKLSGIQRSTGDLYVYPLLIGMMIGRVGCFLTGVSDGTWGKATTFFMGFDAGDGVKRHPTPLYEIIALGLIGLSLWLIKQRIKLNEGDLFKLFIMAYCAWRFMIEFLKPVVTYGF